MSDRRRILLPLFCDSVTHGFFFFFLCGAGETRYLLTEFSLGSRAKTTARKVNPQPPPSTTTHSARVEDLSTQHVQVGLVVFRHKHHLIGLVVKASASRTEDPGSESGLRQDFARSSHTSDLKIGTPVANLPGAWRYRVSAGTGRPGVSIL